MAVRLRQVLLAAVVIFAAGFVALSLADGAARWVGPAIIATVVALIGFGLRYVLVTNRS